MPMGLYLLCRILSRKEGNRLLRCRLQGSLQGLGLLVFRCLALRRRRVQRLILMILFHKFLSDLFLSLMILLPLHLLLCLHLLLPLTERRLLLCQIRHLRSMLTSTQGTETLASRPLLRAVVGQISTTNYKTKVYFLRCILRLAQLKGINYVHLCLCLR